MENKTRWDWHKEKHLGHHYMTIISKAMQQRFQEEPPHVVLTYALTTNTKKKKNKEPKNF
jgi:hypothetical protein